MVGTHDNARCSQHWTPFYFSSCTTWNAALGLSEEQTLQLPTDSLARDTATWSTHCAGKLPTQVVWRTLSLFFPSAAFSSCRYSSVNLFADWIHYWIAHDPEHHSSKRHKWILLGITRTPPEWGLLAHCNFAHKCELKHGWDTFRSEEPWCVLLPAFMACTSCRADVGPACASHAGMYGSSTWMYLVSWAWGVWVRPHLMKDPSVVSLEET